MSIRHIFALSSLAALELLAFACSVPADPQGSDQGATGAPTTTPDNMPICTTCEPPMPAMPSSENLGQIGALNDSMGGYRTFTITVMAPKAGTLTATYLNSFGNQWRVLSIAPVGGTPVAGGAAATVTAGQEVSLQLAFQADPNSTGVLNTELSIYNEGARTLVPVDVTTAWFYDPGPAINVYLSELCGNEVAGEYELGATSGGTCGGDNQLKFAVNMVNLGNQAGTYQLSFATSVPVAITCTQTSGSLAPEQVLKDVCSVSETKIPVTTLDGGLGYVGWEGNPPIPLDLWVTTPTQKWAFTYTLNPIESPPTGSAGGTGTGASGGSGSGSGGGTSSCANIACSYNCGSGCGDLGTFCSLADAQSAIVAADGDGCEVCCDQSCMLSTCDTALSIGAVGVISTVGVAK